MWYYAYKGHQLGPVDINGLKNLMRSDVVNGASMIWREGWEEWKRLNETDLIWLYEEVKGQPLVANGHPGMAEDEEEPGEFDDDDEEDDDIMEFDEDEEKIWYYQQEGYTWGPAGASEIQRLLHKGEIDDVTLVRRNGEATWHHLDETDLIWLLQADEGEFLDEEEEDDIEDEDGEEEFDPAQTIEEDEQVWYYNTGDQIYGPVTSHEIAVMKVHCEVNDKTLVSSTARGPWQKLDETELAKLQPEIIDPEEEE